VVEALLQRLSDEDENARWRAALTLGRLGRAEPGVVEALLGRLGDEDADVRESAASALGWLGQAEPEVVEALVGRLSDEEADVRGSAAIALGQLGQAEPGVVEALVGRLGDEEAEVRWRAAYVLGELGQAEPEIIEALVDMLRNGDRAAIAAFRMLLSQREVIDALLTAIDDRDKVLCSGAALALDTDAHISFSGEKAPAIAFEHLALLTQLLDSEMEVAYSIFFDFLEEHRRFKDIAWNLLWQYSQETGERIYWDDEEEKQ
jgi:hypothetical protein